MEPELIATVIGAIAAALGGGFAGGRYLMRAHPVETVPKTTGPIHTIVTGEDCKENRRDLTDSFVRSFDEVRGAITRQTDTISELKGAVTKLESKVDVIPVEIENASIKAIRSHEDRYHSKHGDHKGERK